MAKISSIRYCNVVYENGNKRYNDEVFQCSGHNTAILLENGGGKTVFIQTALQAILPHADLGERKVKETFSLESGAAHIAIEWILSDKPRRYALTVVTIYLKNNELKSYKYVYEYGIADKHRLENLPFSIEENGIKRPAGKGEMNAYYTRMTSEQMNAHTFQTTKEFHAYIEENFKIIPDEWRSIALINADEGGVDEFFTGCKTTADLVDKLLLPTVERGLRGDGSGEFANSFESQREHFKKHKELEKSIRESESIKEALKSYVAVYAHYDQHQKKYMAKKESAKALYKHIKEQHRMLTQTIDEISIKEQEAVDEKKDIGKREMLVEVTEAKRAWEKAKGIYNVEQEHQEELDSQMKEKKKRRHVLKLAKYQLRIDEAEAEIRICKEQLETLNQNLEIEELQEQLEENSCYLKGYFENEIEKYTRYIKRIESEISRYQEEVKGLESNKKKWEEEKYINEQAFNKLSGKVEHNEKEMEKIGRSILDQSDHEDIATWSPKWQKRIGYLENHQIELLKKQEEYKQAKEIKEQNSKKLMDRKIDCKEEKSRSIQQLEEYYKAGESILTEVKLNLPAFHQLGTIYLKEKQILDSLGEQVEKCRHEKEEALLVERQCARFIDEHQEQQYFTAEPLLEVWVDKWRTAFSFLQIGTAFIAEENKIYANGEGQKVGTNEAKWSELIVVADGQEEKLVQKLNEKAKDMTYPVGVISLSKARQMAKEGLAVNDVVYPMLWEKVITVEGFDTYKDEMNSKLDEARSSRKEKENTLKIREACLNQLQYFLKEYPYETYAKLKEQVNKLRQEENELEHLLLSNEQEIKILSHEIQQLTVLREAEKEEKYLLEQKAKEAIRYFELQSETKKYEKQMNLYREEMVRIREKLSIVKRDRNRLNEQIEDCNDQYDGYRNQINRLQDDETYKKVKDYDRAYSSEDVIYLKQVRQAVEDKLNDKQQGRDELQRRIDQAQKRRKENEEGYEQENEELGCEIEVPQYCEDYENELKNLNKQLKILDEQLTHGVMPRVIKLKTLFDKAEEKYETLVKEYKEDYGIIEKYIEDCKQERETISKDNRALKDKIAYLDKEHKRAQVSREKMDKILILLEKKDEVFGYLGPEVKDKLLESSQREALAYEFEEIINNCINELVDFKKQVDLSKEKIETQKASFKKFCERDIRDSRLRHMVIQGVEQKTEYEELTTWQKRMITQINHTVKILEEDLRDKDKIVANFILHLQDYLVNVGDELKEIPQKTRVRTEEGWKKIYEFTIPAWQVEEGQGKIRAYMEYLLNELGQESFLDTEGKEDTQKVKKYIKEKFKLKELLKVVMGNDTIKIKCRKVSSMNHISTQTFSWDTSTKWSGGERWSKNMALYLGILNYLAEKRQNIEETNRTSRVVILDNPFGKASSGHVLEPVFFIAQQIGFQVIALTAHSEGDFIRKYFPIVYSCKLRRTANQRTNIMTKEQEIKKAYFMDNDPLALGILGRYNQMNLFE